MILFVLFIVIIIIGLLGNQLTGWWWATCRDTIQLLVLLWFIIYAFEMCLEYQDPPLIRFFNMVVEFLVRE